MDAFCETKHIYRAHHIGLDRFDRIVLIVNGRGGTCQIIDLVDLEQDGLRNIMPHQFICGVAHQMSDVLLTAGKKVIEAYDLVPIFNKPFAQVRTDKTGTAGD